MIVPTVNLNKVLRFGKLYRDWKRIALNFIKKVDIRLLLLSNIA